MIHNTTFAGLSSLSNEQLVEISKGCISISEIMRKVGYEHINGYAHKVFSKRLKKAGVFIDTKRSMAWNTGNVNIHVKDIEDYLVLDGPFITTSKLKHRLYRVGLKEKKCEICSLTDWMNKPIRLHLDHVNGNNNDRRIENLRVLCPNCHSQTETYAKIKD